MVKRLFVKQLKQLTIMKKTYLIPNSKIVELEMNDLIAFSSPQVETYDPDNQETYGDVEESREFHHTSIWDQEW